MSGLPGTEARPLPAGEFAENDHQDDVRRFVVKFLRSQGCDVRIAGAVLDADLPADFAKNLGVGRHLTLRLQADAPVAEAELLTFGSPLLDRLLALAGERGRVSNLLFTTGLDPAFGQCVLAQNPFLPPAGAVPRAYRRLCRTVGRFTLANGQIALERRRIVYQWQMLFVFRVAFVSDEKRENIIPVLIDPLTEEPDTLVDLADAMSFPLPPPADGYSMTRLYRKACTVLEEQVGQELLALEREADQRLAHELKRIDEYYRELAQETLDPLRKTFRRMAALSVRTQLARSYESQNRFGSQLQKMKLAAKNLEGACETELLGLEEEKKRRQNELAEKYRTRMEVLLCSIAALRVPRVEYVLHLQGPAERSTTFYYDILRDRNIDLNCDCCNTPLQTAFLCGCGELVCPACFHICPACARPVCASCAAGRCHLCGAPVCAACAVPCPLSVPAPVTPASPAAGPATLLACPQCAGHYCLTCTNWAEGVSG